MSPFLLDPEFTYLNHGSFGACPRPVFDTYQAWQRRLEAQPVRFMIRELPDALAHARQRLEEFVNAAAGTLVFVPNPTFAVNEIAKSLGLGPDDEVLLSDHEYGGCLRAWQFAAEQRSFQLVEQPLSLPAGDAETLADEFWAGVTPHTRVIFLSQITSPTALTLPVAEVCSRARGAGILTVIDGAHVPGQLDLDLQALGADFYVATCHKWLCGAKGSAFLYAAPGVQGLLQPLVAGWGWGPERTFRRGSDFLDFHEWPGTHDPSPYLTVPAAIDFHQQHHSQEVRDQCHELGCQLLERAAALKGVSTVHRSDQFAQMALLKLNGPAGNLQDRLLQEFHIEIPVTQWREHSFLRASFQSYNTAADVDRLVEALRVTLAN